MRCFSTLARFVLLTFMLTGTALSGISRYGIARDSTAGNYVPIAGSTFSAWTVTFVGIGADDGHSAVTPIGFSFVFDGVAYTQFKATLNGCIILGGQGTAETFTNDLASTTHKPLIAPYWDDLATVTTNNATYSLTGTPGSRVLTVQWASFVNSGGTGGPFNFQAKLFESDSHIEFVYGSMGTATSYSTGLVDPIGAAGHFLSLTTANGSVFSSATATNTLAAPPGQDLKYTFTRPTPIGTDITVTPGAGAYPTVQAAMDTLSFYGTSGNRNVFVAGTTTEPAAVGNWDFIPGTHPSAGNFTVTLRLDPSVSAATITGNIAGDAFRLRGQRNFTVDGDDPIAGGTQRGLTISNANVGATGRTLVLLEGTQGAVIKNCILTSNALSGAAATFGVVAILTSNISTATGTPGIFGANNGNVFENNDIRDGATNRPTNCILLSGTTTAGLRNVGNIIRLNDIRNYGGSTATRGIRIEANDSLTVIERNNIFTISTTIADVRGIMINAASVFGTQIIRNRIYDQLSTSASATIQGIRLFSATSGPAIVVANNFITIDAPAGLTTGTVGGIDQSTGLVDVVFNSVRIGGSVTAGTTGTTAAYRRTGSSTGVIRNNIFYNAATNAGGTATHWAVASSASTGLSSNHNNLFVDGVGGVVGTTTGTTAGNTATLFDWQNATSQDLNSLSILPPFTSATDLHIPNATATALESGGISSSGVTNDIDGDTRASYTSNPTSGPNSAPDIGADEFNGTLADATAPNIAYTTLLNTPLAANRTVVARIRDAASGVQRSAGGAPRLWFKKNSGSYVQVTGVEAPADSFTFTFDHSLVGGVVAGDTIYYYVAAQDSNGVVGTSPVGTGGTINPPNATVPTPNFYRILLTLTGTFNVGATETYANLGALFNHINSNAVGGNLTINITSDVTEPASAVLNEIFPVGGPWTITIRPVGGAWVDSGSIAGALVDLNGADNVVIDGNILGVKSLTFRNISATTTASTIAMRNDATGNTITNCILEGAGTSTTTSGTILFGAGTVTGNDNNTISNNEIRDRATTGARHAVGIISLSSADPASNSHNTITGNNMYNFTFAGVNVQTTAGGNWTISNNSFYYNNATVPTTAQTSINFNPGLTADNNLIYGNYIGGQAPAAGGASWTSNAAAQFAGILATVGTTTPSIVRKNTVKNITLTNTGAQAFFGIAMVNGSATVDSNTVGDPSVIARPVFVSSAAPAEPGRPEQTATGKGGATYDMLTPETAVLAVTEPAEVANGPGTGATVSPATVPNSITAAGTSAMTGIQNQSSGTVTIANNEVSNMTAAGTGTGAIVRGINNGGTVTSVTTVMNNSVHHLTSASAATSLTAPTAAGILWFPGGFEALGSVVANRVYSIIGTNTGAVATNTMGMMLTNCSVPILRNRVYDVRNASTGVSATAPPTATGLYIRFMSGALVANNMASVGYDQSTNTVFTGLWNGAGTNNNYGMFYNSASVAGSSAGGAHHSFGFLRGNHTGTAITTTILGANNIFANTRTGGTGKHYAIANQSTTLDTTGWGPGRFNFNVYNNADPSTFGLWGPTDLTFGGWQAATSGDAASLTGNPGFLSATDLHISPSAYLPSNNAFPLPGIVDVDFDNEPRSATTPDRGADEYVAIALPPPVVSGVARNTRVPATSDTTVVTCTIRDTLGITSANLIYNVNGTPSQVAMVRTSGTDTNGTYRGVIPGAANANGNRVEYQIQANSLSGSNTTTPIVAANSYYAGISPLSLSGLRRVTAGGKLIDSLYYARVTGTVNGPNFQTTNLGYHFQDAVGGIQLFSFGMLIPPLNLGDSIVVTGRLAQFRGLTEIIPDTQTVDIQVVATGRTVTPMTVPLPTFKANPEMYESMLIKVQGLNRRDATPPWPAAGGSANIVMYQGVVTDTIIMRIDSDTEIDGSPEPAWPRDVAGVVSQFSSATSVYNNGYQTQPRYLTDFTDPTGPLLFEQFESGVFPPAGWSTYIVAGDSGWRSATVAPFSGTTHAFVRYNPAGTMGSKFLVTRRIDVPADAGTGTYELSFRARRAFTTPFPPDTLYVKLSTTDSLPASFGPAIYKCFTGDTLSSPDVYGVNYRRFQTNITGIAGTLFIAFDHQDDDGQTIYLDDVKLEALNVHDIGVANVSDLPADQPGSQEPSATSRAQQAERAGKASLELAPVAGKNAPDASFEKPLIHFVKREANGTVTLEARVANYGSFVENSYQVGWTVDGVAQPNVNNTQPLEIGDVDTLALSWASPTPGTHTARAWTILAGDVNAANDTSAPFVFEVLPDNIIYEETFADTTIPAGWLVVNNDGSPGATTTWQYQSMVTFTGGGGTVLPQAGNRFWFASYTGANGFLIDEWLISPQIPAANFDTLYFYAGAVGGSFPDSLKVKVSTTGNNVADFVHELGYFRIPGPIGSWHRFAVPLTQFRGQNIYFAINYYIVNGGPSGTNSDNVWADHPFITGAPIGFFDDFEAYTVGQQLVVQNPTDWSTWSGPAGTAEDPFISSAQAFSGTKSVVIVTNNDLVKRLGNDTTGTHEISFKFYVPSGKAGYFNTLATFTPPSTFNWGMEAYFDSTGNGRLFAGSATAVPFTYTRNAWQTATVVVNLTIDSARFVVNGNVIRTWRWTAGASGGTSPKRLAANDFYGATAWDQMFMDDYRYRPGTWTGVDEQPEQLPETFVLMQNYPNPFNPTTTIQYALPSAATVSLRIYNLLGQEVATLVDESQSAGYHTAIWNGRNQYGAQVATGVYFYRIEARSTDGAAPFTALKKMLLVK